VLIGPGPVDSGWGAVAAVNDWVRYDSANWNEITPVEGFYCDDKTADQLMRFDGSDWVSASGGVSGGKIGIADSNGVITYYSDYASANAAASSGDTIQQFTNIDITTPLVLKDGVNYNFNGYTLTNTAIDTTTTIESDIATGYTGKLYNGKAIKAGGNGYCMTMKNNANLDIEFIGFEVENLGGSGFSSDLATASIRIKGLKATGTVRGIYTATGCEDCIGIGGSAEGIYGLPSGSPRIENCEGYSTSASGIINYGFSLNTYAQTVSGSIAWGTSGRTGDLKRCEAVNFGSGVGFQQVSDLKDCIASTNTGRAAFDVFEIDGGEYTASGALTVPIVDGCLGFKNAKASGNSTINIVNASSATSGDIVYNRITNTNTGTGRGINCGINTNVFFNFVEVSNVANYAIASSGTFYYGHNVFVGTNAPVIGTQGIVNIEDNQGNLTRG